MEFFAPIQHEQVHSWLTERTKSLQSRYHAKLESRPEYPTILAFRGVALLNVPVLLKFTSIKLQARTQALRGWRKWSTASSLGRWTAPMLERLGLRSLWIDSRSFLLGAPEKMDWTTRLSLSPKSPLWTWITSGFVHHEFDHFFGNMVALYIYAPVCSQIRGMSPLHVGAITLGSSVFASVAALLEWHLRAPMFFGNYRYGLGASGIVSAFAALAVVSSPCKPVGMFGVSEPCCYIAGVQFFRDIVGLLQVDFGLEDGLVGSKTGYAAHVGGAVFGVLYYYGVLRRQSPFKGEGRRLVVGDPPTNDASQTK